MADHLLTKFRKSKKAKIIFCIVGLLFSLFYMLWMFGGNINSWIPNDNRLVKVRDELKKATAATAELEKKQKLFANVERLYNKNLENFWNEQKHGIASVELRKKIEQSAQRAGLKLGRIGAVRQNRINSDLHFLEIDMAATETLDLLISFFDEIYKENPKMYWKRADFRHEHLQKSKRLVFNGTIRLIGIEQNSEANKK